MRKKLAVLLIIIMCFSIIAGCSAKRSESATPKAAQQEATVREESVMDTASGSPAGGAGTIPLNRKLIVSVNATLRVDKLQESIDVVEAMTEEAGGYIRESHVNESDVRLTLMIPAGSTDAFMKGLEGVGVFVSKSKNTEDVTDAYFDTQTRIKNLESEIETLRKLLQKGGWKVSEILEIEREIRRLTEELELLKGQITNLDRRIQYSQVSIRLVPSGTNIRSEDPNELGYQIRRAFKDGVEALIGGFTALISLIAFLLPIAPFIAAIYFLWTKVIRRALQNRRKHE